MANLDIGNELGVVDKRQPAGGKATTDIVEIANTKDVTTLRTRLAALSGYFTATRLDQMSTNDMIYALRIHSADVAGI